LPPLDERQFCNLEEDILTSGCMNPLVLCNGIQQTFELRLFSSLVKVFPDKAPLPQPECGKLTALRCETVSFQIAYRYPDNLTRTWGRLIVDSPIADWITTRRVRYMPGSIPRAFPIDNDGYITTQAGVFPDLLQPFDFNRLPMISGQWQSIWFDVEVPIDAKSGNYSITVKIENESGEILGDSSTELDVIGAALPSLDIPYTRWFHTDCLATYYGVEVFSERHWEIIENFLAYAIKHGQNMVLTPIHTPPLDTEVGGERPTVQLVDVSVENNQYTFLFDKLDKWVAMCKRLGIKYYEIAHLFTQWGAKSSPKIMGTKDGVYTRLFGWETEATGAAYANYLSQMLPALTGRLKELDVANQAIFHISDEPEIGHMESYSAARKLVEPHLKGFKIIDALSDYVFYEKGALPIPIASNDHIDSFIEGEVPELWCYYCVAQSYSVANQFFMLPSFRSRILGIQLYKYDIAGFLHWGYNFYYSAYSVHPINPFFETDCDGAFTSGDAFIVYPGADGYPLGSIRLMVFQEALSDFRALRLLESLAGRSFVLAMIDEGLTNPVTFSRYPQSDFYLFNLRRRVNTEIAKRLHDEDSK